MAAQPPSYIDIKNGALRAIYDITTGGQSVSYQGRSMTMADLEELRGIVTWCDDQIAQQAGKAARSRVSYVTPVV